MASARVLLKSAVFTLLVPFTLAVGIPRLLVKYRPHPALPLSRPVSRLAGGISMVFGVLIYLHTTVRFAEKDGTPSPTDEPEELVTAGLYGYCRNPMYVGVLLVVFGQALWYRSVAVCWWAVGCWIGFHNRVIGWEEPHLAEKHGEAYEAYRAAVPRWGIRLDGTHAPRTDSS